MRKKRFLFVAMLFTALTWGFASCDNDKGNEPDDPLDNKTPTEKPTETPVVPKKTNKELYFNQHDGTQISFDTLNKYLAMDNIDTIFMIPTGTFFAPEDYKTYLYFRLARHNLLEERIDLSPRIRGRGDFITNLGYPSASKDDSLWMVEKGWTVNKYWIDLLNQNTK